jgi:hypothetical protein
MARYESGWRQSLHQWRSHGVLETDDIAEFEKILRQHGMKGADFSLSVTDTTDPKTDEVVAIQGELTVRCKSTGQSRQYIFGDGAPWLALFRHDIEGGAFAGQAAPEMRPLSSTGE